MTYTVVIPARFGSTRLPGKALADIHGLPMVQHVYHQASMSNAKNVFVATDDKRIEEVLQAADIAVLMTDSRHQSGTDRLAEVASILALNDDDIVVNVQGDEPQIPPRVIDQVAENLARHRDCVCATLCEPIVTQHDFLNPSVVKVVRNTQGKALYFSRAPVPWPRDAMSEQAETATQPESTELEQPVPVGVRPLRHVGIYAYRVGLLRRFVDWAQTPLEKLESLEQLRILENGEAIHVDEAIEPVPGGVDTPEDLANVRRQMADLADG